jgi:GAF domain-containing protein
MKLSIFNSPKRPKSPPDRLEVRDDFQPPSGSADEPPGIQLVSVQETRASDDAASAGISPAPDGPIDHLRQRILNRLLLVAVLLGVLVYIVYLPGMLQTTNAPALQWAVLGLYSLIWIFVIVAVARQRMAYARRAAILFLSLYATGLAFLLLGGTIGSGQAVLVVIPFIAALLIGPRGRTTSLVLSIGALLLAGALVIGGLVPMPEPLPVAGRGSLLAWVIAVANFSLLAIGGTVSLGVLLDGLQDQLAGQRARANELEIQRDQEAAQAGERAHDLHRRLVQIRTVAEINRAISRVLDIDRLLPQVCELVRQRFSLYYVGIFLIEQAALSESIGPISEPGGGLSGLAETPGDRRPTGFVESTSARSPAPTYAVLKAGSGEAGRIMLAEGHKLAVGGDSMIGWATANRQPRISQKIRPEGGVTPVSRFANPHLPLTRSELALPIQVSDISAGDENLAEAGREIRILGAMTIQSTQEGAFDQDDIVILQGIADGLASAIENARLFEATQANLEEIRTLHRQYLEQAWRLETALRGEIEFSFEDETRVPVGDAALFAAEEEEQLEMPIRLRDQVIGSLILEPAARTGTAQDARRTWTADDLALVEAVTDQVALALENARLLEETRRKVNLEHTAATITSKLWASADVETILRTVLQELGASLGVREGSIELWPPETHPANRQPVAGPAGNQDQTQGEALDASD